MRKEVETSNRISLEEKKDLEPSPGVSQPGQETTREWAVTHTDCIDLYNAWALLREPYSQQVKRWRGAGT